MAGSLFIFGCQQEAQQSDAAANGTGETVDQTSTVGDAQIEGSEQVVYLRSQPQFSTFVELAEATGLLQEIGEANGLTLFVPTNEAFQALGAEQLDAVNSDKMLARNVLAAHSTIGTISATDLKEIPDLRMLSQQGDVYEIESRDGSFFIGEARIVEADAFNGPVYIHVIDTVLRPEAMDENAEPDEATINLWYLPQSLR
ncbi:MAG: fasciclin domain-containing protein [Fimbriimonadaceae bacterium]